MKHICIAIPKNKAEEIRKKLIEKNLISKEFKVIRDENYVYFPVEKEIEIEGCFICEKDFEYIKIESYEEILASKGIKPSTLSIDIIGEIAILRGREENLKEIANAILLSNKHIKSVFYDRGVYDEYRVRNVEFIAGENKTETIHNEYGIKIKLDISRVYFSPRLAGERMRVAKMVGENEIVIDMFAGVAPFSLLIAKFSKAKKIFAIDKNVDAIKYARENILLNKIKNIEVIEGDAKDVLPCLPSAEHVIMNLPHKSFDFLPFAIEKGKIIHYYEIIERKKIDKRVEEIKEKIRSEGYEAEIENIRVIGNYSPSKYKVGMELFIKKF
ncbi:MAG: class I SAM-dependent methyltransferase family protein [Thermoplasmatales archaeon]|nr:class I SAM-dependent methyltransferase family protein [Thermoplasmatales archaeon]